jgi:signal peptidase
VSELTAVEVAAPEVAVAEVGPARPVSRARRVAGALVAVVAWGVLFVAGGALALDVVVPRLSGATPYAVLTSSMKPQLPAGTLVVVRPIRPESIGVGTVITYQLRSGDPEVVTHRVVAQAVDGAGARTFRTRGDAYDLPDPGWVKPVQLKGEVWYAVPYLGRLHAALSGRDHQQLVYLTAAALLAYAAAMFAGAVRARHTQLAVGGQA